MTRGQDKWFLGAYILYLGKGAANSKCETERFLVVVVSRAAQATQPRPNFRGKSIFGMQMFIIKGQHATVVAGAQIALPNWFPDPARRALHLDNLITQIRLKGSAIRRESLWTVS